MANNNYNLFTYINPYREIIEEYDLPNGDASQFISGAYIDEKTLSQRIGIFTAHKGVYGKNEIVIDSGATQGTGIETSLLEENGYYYVRMKSAGGRGKNEDRFTGK
jgi:hypothetical protein